MAYLKLPKTKEEITEDYERQSEYAREVEKAFGDLALLCVELGSPALLEKLIEILNKFNKIKKPIQKIYVTDSPEIKKLIQEHFVKDLVTEKLEKSLN